MTTRIFSLDDLLAQTNTPLATLGIDSINASIEAHLAYLNASVNEQVSLFSEQTPDARRIWGGTETWTMKEVDEYGDARTQAPTSGTEVGFPLRKFSVSTGWSQEWYQRAMVSELAKRMIGAQTAYLTKLQDEMVYGIFENVSYTYVDYLVDSTSLSVKAFLNADSIAIPNAPNGTAFTAASHQHYVGTSGASLAYTDIDTLIANVTEHGNMKGLALFTTPTVATAMAILATKPMLSLSYANIIAQTDADSTIVKDNLDADPANKLVGYFAGVPVFTRSWVPASMILCMATGAAEKPLVYRVDRAQSLRGLLPVVEFGAPTISAKVWRAYFGFSPWNRAAGAVLDTAHQTTYTCPTTLVR
jgi:hypothetical protein